MQEISQAPVFDPSILSSRSDIHPQFVWPEEDRPLSLEATRKIQVPIMDLAGFFSGDGAADAASRKKHAAEVVDEACRKHGFFMVKNHGVEASLVAGAHDMLGSFFGMPLAEKERAKRKVGESYGYASSFTGRFSSNLPWKETMSFRHAAGGGAEDSVTNNMVENYALEVLGPEFNDFGKLYQEYCRAMNKLALEIMELLGFSLLGSCDRTYFKDFFDENDSILRLNYYPPCQRSDLVLGTGPHNDPTSLTILHEDQVGGLQVFVDGEWQAVTPVQDAFIINIGDTLSAMTNGIYKSCLHRAVVNSRTTRTSIAYFMNPMGDKIVTPPTKLVEEAQNKRAYPDFTWPLLQEFTQKHYRSDQHTLTRFSDWVVQQNIHV